MVGYDAITLKRLKEVFDTVASECKLIMQTLLESDEIGINEKVGINTLADSRTHNQIEGINVDDFGIIKLLVNEYAVLYVDGIGYEWARRPANPDISGARLDQSWPPVDIIVDWASRRGIPTVNETIYKICWSIWWKGIKARPFIEPTFDEIDNMYDEWADKIFDALCEGLDEFFCD